MIWMDVDTALASVPINTLPLVDDTDFKTIEDAVVYNAAGLALFWNFKTTAGVTTVTAVTPTTAGVYDWTDFTTSGMYAIEMPASGGASANNDTEGFGHFTGVATGVLPWRGPIIGFRAAALNNALIDGGDVLDVSVTELGGVAQSLTDLKDFADAGYDPGTNKVQGVVLVDTLTTYTGNTPQTGDSYLGATAHANIVNQYDGDGIAGDTFPATQSQISGIANVGSASHIAFTGETLTTPATTTGGSYTDTEALDGTYMYWDTVTGGFEAELTGNIGAGTPSGIKITGYMNGANDTVRVQMWDYQAGTPAWVTIGSWSGGGSTVNQVLPYDAFIGMVGTGANLGNIRLRLYNDNGVTDTALTSANIYIDQVFCEYSPSAVSTLDAVYFDSGASNTNTVPGTDGVPGNPVSTEAAVNTLLTATGLHKVAVALESTITFATSHVDEIWEGIHWILANGGQNLSGSHFIGAVVTGTASASVDPIDYFACRFGTCSLPQFHIVSSGFQSGTVTLNEAGNYVIADSHSSVTGATTPIIDTGAAIANVNLSMPNYQQGIEIANLNATGTDNFSISGIGQIVYSASSGGAVNQRGRWKVTNTGGVTITYDDPSQNEIDALADTNELQGDWVDGGRLDLIVDATLADTADMQPKLGAPAGASMSADIATIDTNVDAVLVDTSTTLPALIDDLAIKKNTAFSNFEFLMVLTSDGRTPATGLTVTGQRSINGGAFGAVSGTITEVSNGIYQFDALAADTNGDVITWRFSAATADDTFLTFKTVA